MFGKKIVENGKTYIETEKSKYVSNWEKVGLWWSNNSIELIKIDGKTYALNGWNGEEYLDCWRCTGKHNLNASKEKYTIEEIYEETSENMLETIGYIVDLNC